MPKHTKPTLPTLKSQPRRSRPPVNGKHYGTRNLILDTLKAPSASGGLSTSEIVSKVRKSSGTPIPEQSFRQALRTLVRYKVVQGRRSGREKIYRISNPAAVSASPSPTVGPKAPSVPLAIDTTNLPPHKLAVGEVLVLHVGETHVETVSNVYGKVVLERHPRVK